ncbi:hypothetical protein ABI084_14740, partial [Enterococcus faecium]|uniref:hypothetical protein n=1 Tax=Enterococcus faecium TaxID=1352 RepID=UPI003F41EE66
LAAARNPSIPNQRGQGLESGSDDADSTCEGFESASEDFDSTSEDIESGTEQTDSGSGGAEPNYPYKSMQLRNGLNFAQNARRKSGGSPPPPN